MWVRSSKYLASKKSNISKQPPDLDYLQGTRLHLLEGFNPRVSGHSKYPVENIWYNVTILIASRVSGI